MYQAVPNPGMGRADYHTVHTYRISIGTCTSVHVLYLE